jgi:hypothetical protein
MFEPYSVEIILKEVIDFSKIQFVEMNDGEVLLANGNNYDHLFYGINLQNCNGKNLLYTVEVRSQINKS